VLVALFLGELVVHDLAELVGLGLQEGVVGLDQVVLEVHDLVGLENLFLVEVEGLYLEEVVDHP